MTDLPTLALSVRQPWAWAIIFAGKDIENRGHVSVWKGKMKPRRIAIHAAKGMTQAEYWDAAETINGICPRSCPAPGDLIRGAIIGAVDVVDIVSKSRSPWFFGPRGLVLQNPEACEPIACSGMLGYFGWTPAGEIERPLKWMLPTAPRPIKAEQGERLPL